MDQIKKISEAITGLTNKRKFMLSFICGSLSSLAFAPTYVILLPFIAFPILFWLLDACKNKKSAFLIGWFFGFGHFVTGLYWFANALLTDAERFAWMIPLAVSVIPAALAVYIGLVCLITYVLPFSKTNKVIIFTVMWTIFEFLRGILFTGFPWNLIGYIWTFSDNMIQITSVTGILGLSFFTVLSLTLPSQIIEEKGSKWVICSIVIILSIWIFGYIRLQNSDVKTYNNIKIRIVQPNNSTSPDNWLEENRRNIFIRHMDMTLSDGFSDITHVIWPEATLPTYINETAPLLKIISSAVPKNGLLLMGSSRLLDTLNGPKVWNSLHVLNPKGDIVDFYDKSHLVPFGEYVPLRIIFDKLPFIKKITHGFYDIREGDGPKTISLPEFPPFGPQICYEAIFSGSVIDENKRPEIMVNVTNDAWYGNSSGPYQHFNMARVRATEEGLPLIRAANSGISALIDPYGRIIAKTELGKENILDVGLVSSLETPTTYGKLRNWSTILIIVFFVILSVFRQKNV